MASYDYVTSLECIKKARSKKGYISRKFIQILNRENIAMPNFNADVTMCRSHEHVPDDVYSQLLLMQHGPLQATVDRAPKFVSGNGNCLFNSASVALIGRTLLLNLSLSH